MKSRLLSVALLIASMSLSQAAGWDMAGRDPAHTNSIQIGPKPPLKEAWIAKSEDPAESTTNWPVVSNGVVYAASGSGAIAVEASTGKRLWWRDFGGSYQVAPAVDDTSVFLPLAFDEMVALDRLTGERIWTFNHPSDESLDASPVLSDGHLYFGLPDAKRVLAVNAKGGSVRWEVSTELQPGSIPAISDGVVVFPTAQVGGAGRADRVIVLALEAETGKEIWRFENKESSSSPSIVDGMVIFGGGDFHAYALELKTGKVRWKTPVEDKFDRWNMPAVALGDIFLADRVGNIYRFDGDTGKRKWIATNTVGTMDQSFPVIAGKTLFIGSGAGELYAFDTDNGRLLWKDSINGIVQSGAVDDQRFYFGVKLGEDDGLHAYQHDPHESLIRSPARQNPLPALFGGLLLFVVLLAIVVLVSRYRAKKVK